MEFDFKTGIRRKALRADERCIGMRILPDHSVIYLVIYSAEYFTETGGTRIHTEKYSTATLELLDVKYFKLICNACPNYGSAEICITDNRKLLILRKWSDDNIHVYDLETTENIKLYKEPHRTVNKTIFSFNSPYYMYISEKKISEHDEKSVITHHSIADSTYKKILDVGVMHPTKIKISNNGSVIMGIDRYTEHTVTIWYTHTDKVEIIDYTYYITDIAFSSDDKYILMARYSYIDHLYSIYIYRIDDTINNIMEFNLSDFRGHMHILDFDHITENVYRLTYNCYQDEDNKPAIAALIVTLKVTPSRPLNYYKDVCLNIKLQPYIFHETTYAAIENSELVIYSCFNKPFKSHTFYRHPHNIQCLAVRVLAIANKLVEERPDLPQLPVEILLLIISLFTKKDLIKEF